MDLAFIWAMIIASAVFLYVVLDGFDLGLGIIFPLVKDAKERDVIVNSIAPVWDGNETWLVLGGGGLFAVFPLAYAILLPALYAPLIAMLLALVFRGVAFEFRFRTVRAKPWWDAGLIAGSLVATFAQGIALGTVVQGVEVSGRAYGGGWWDWLTPFSLFTGMALVAGYAMLGIGWLILKTDGPLQERMFRLALPAGAIVLALIGIVSLWTPFLSPEIRERWFAWPNIALVSPVPLLVGAVAFAYYRAVSARNDLWPFLLGLALFLLCFIGLGISLYPYAVPRSVTIWDAAAPDSSLAFLLVGAAVLLPIILAYTAHAYWVFRGKIDPDAGYH